MTRTNQASTSSNLPTATEISASNGPKALLIDIPDCPAMKLELSFRAGEAFCPPEKPELAHFLEHLVAMSNQRYRSQREFEQAVRLNGGWTNAWTEKFNLWYDFNAPDDDWQRMLNLLLLTASQPLFSPIEFETEKEVVRQELEEYRDGRWKLLYGDVEQATGFASARLGHRIDCLADTSLEDAKAHYKKTHSADNCRLIVAGHLPSERQQLIKRRLEDLNLPAGNQIGRFGLPAERLSGAGLVYLPDDSARTVYLDLFFVNDRPLTDLAEFDNLEILWALLAGEFDSRIHGQARDRGLIYLIEGEFGSTGASSYGHFCCQASPDNLDSLVDLIQTEIDRLLAADLPAGEVDSTKARLIGGFSLDHLTPASWNAYYRGYYLDYDRIAPVDYSARLARVDRESILSLAGQIFGPADWTLGLLGRVPAATRQRLEARLNRNRKSKPVKNDG